MRELVLAEPIIDASEIRIFDLHEPPSDFPDDARIRYVRGDVRDAEALRKAAAGADAVIHMAAMVDWGTHPETTVYAINTGGTKNALEAARSANATAFVYTSSLDAVMTGRSQRDVDESLPFPEKPANAYCGSKAEAEKLVMAADAADARGTVAAAGAMRTTVIRPSSVWGEGDPYHISALLELARKKTYVRIGDGTAVQQHVYSGNLARAHLLACRELLEASAEGREPRCAGRPYFVTDSAPENFFRFFDRIVEASGYPIVPKNAWIPRDVMLAAGAVSESLAWMLRPFVHWNPKVSRFAVNYTCSDFTFTAGAAERDFDFEPKYGLDEAVGLTADWFRERGPVRPPDIPSFPQDS